MPQDIETSKIHGNATNLLMDKICHIYFDNLIVTTFGRGESGFFWGGRGEGGIQTLDVSIGNNRRCQSIKLQGSWLALYF